MGDVHTPSREVEDEQERLNRQLLELLNEVRVAMPGVQVLFGFLLAVPFQQRFHEVDDVQRLVYFVTLLFAALATALLIAPTAYHRVRFRQGDKPAVIKFGNRVTVAGLICLALAMNGAVLLVTDVIFATPTTIITVVALGTVYLWLWFGVAIARRVQGKRSH